MCGFVVAGFFFFFFFNFHIFKASNLGKRKNSIKIQDIDESCDSTLKIILGGEKS